MIMALIDDCLWRLCSTCMSTRSSHMLQLWLNIPPSEDVALLPCPCPAEVLCVCAERDVWRWRLGPNVGPGCAGLSTMTIWRAAGKGDLAELERLLGHDRDLLEAGDCHADTPLMWASREGHVGVVRWLMDQGAAVNAQNNSRATALLLASYHGHRPVVGLLLQRGADPTITRQGGYTPLMEASEKGHLEVARLLLYHPSAETAIDLRDELGQTALCWACFKGQGGVARALLQSGADPTIAHNNGTTPVAVAKQAWGGDAAEGRRECVAALEVRLHLALSPSLIIQSCGQHPTSPAVILNIPILVEAWALLSWAWWLAGGGALLPAVEGPAGGRPAGERRGGGRGGA
jgi:hypothetical protein